ncbi:MAG: hypothetical protein ACYC6L_04745 [Anaerolineae bacterium]
MTPASWESLAIQIPVVLVFSGVIYLIIKMFLAHITISETRSQAFIEQQRAKNDEAVGDLALIQKQSMERLTDLLCDKVESNGQMLNKIRIENAAHDAFVRTSFRERFGAAVSSQAERSANEEANRMTNQIEQERKG